MKKIFLMIITGLVISSAQAKLPDMCFDGTYVGGNECDLVVDGKQVGAGLVPDDFFVSEEEFAEELDEMYKDLHDMFKQQKLK